MTSSLRTIADQYVDFEVAGKPVSIPYAIVGPPEDNPFGTGRTDRRKNFAGKGTPSQLKSALKNVAKKKGFDLNKATSDQIRDFMTKQGIGVDCSGFSYNVLDQFLRHNRNTSLNRLVIRNDSQVGKIERLLLRHRWVRRSSANTLTNDVNTVKITRAKDIKPGDLIRLTHDHWEGNHIAIVIDVSPAQITYAHSSEYTQHHGPHYGIIKIIKPAAGLEEQNWLEKTRKGENYGHYAFNPKRGDSIRRISFLA